MLTLAVLVGIAFALTLIAFKSRQILFRMAGILGWLGIGIVAWTAPATVGLAALPDGSQYVISLLCVVMVIALALMQMQTEIRREMTTKGKQGFPGAETSSWTEWGPSPGKKQMSVAELSSIRQAEYKQGLRNAINEAKKRRRGY